MRFVHGLANLIRGSVRCMFPLATLAVWTGVVLIPQGTDVLRAALERLSNLDSVGDLVYLGVASALLGMSVWYSMRWLIAADLPALRFEQPTSAFWQTWLPRVAGAFPPLLVGAVFAGRGSFSGATAGSRYGTAGAFAVLAVALFAFFWARRHFVKSLAESPGRAKDGGPGCLPLADRLPPGTTGVVGWAVVLSALLGALFVEFALTAPRVVGAAAIAALALASINLFGSFVLTWLPMRHALPPLGPWLVLWAIAISPFTDNHGGRTLPDASSDPDAPQTISDAFERWSARLPAGDTGPIYVVAAEGGGMRAAYWAAAALEALDATPGFRDHVFALSGVSGGSVGAAMWAASVRSAMCGGSQGPRATEMLEGDFVSPPLAGLFFYDFAQRFLPIPFDRLDRSRGLEESMERASARLPGQPFARTIVDFYRGCPHLPELLLNSTVVETGQRAVLSRLDTSSFVDVFTWPSDGESLSLPRQRLSQLVHHSARFPVISPVASIRTVPASEPGLGEGLLRRWWPDVRLRLADGGYFDNSGIQTALDVLKQIAPKAGTRATLIVITTDPDVASRCGAPTDNKPCPEAPKVDRRPDHARVGRLLHETVPIVESLYVVRNSRLHIAAARAIEDFDRRVIMLPLPPAKDGLKAPLGWALSEQVRADILDGSCAVVRRQVPNGGSAAATPGCRQ